MADEERYNKLLDSELPKEKIRWLLLRKVFRTEPLLKLVYQRIAPTIINIMPRIIKPYASFSFFDNFARKFFI